jgi:MinD superfamily P-loop ATPase
MGRAAVMGVCSARSDGATSVAVALAAHLSITERTLLVDLNTWQPEVAALLDLDAPRNLHHLAHTFQLGAIRVEELEVAIAWRDGLACLAGIAHPDQAAEITPALVRGLVAVASEKFDRVVMDLGRVRPDMPVDDVDRLLWVMRPAPLGLAAFDRAWRVLDADAVPWAPRVLPVVNRAGAGSIVSMDAYLGAQAGLVPIAELPESRDLWRRLEYTHRLDSLLAPLDDERRFERTHSPELLAFRRAVKALAAAVALHGEAQPVEH